MRPLEGVVVLDLTRFLPGAVATMCLANFGAEVIKVEQPGLGDPARQLNGGAWLFAHTNRAKKSIAIDLKHVRGKELFCRLAETADIIIESFRPGVMARLGLGYRDLSPRNERLIYVSLTGHGQSGPYATLAGHDINYISLSGVLDLIGPKNGLAPTIPEIQIADLVGGSCQTLIGILLAIEARHRTGRGQLVDVAMADGLACVLALPLSAFRAAGRSLIRGNELLSGGYACYNLYRAKDGRWIAVGALEQKFWANLCRELGRQELVEDQFSLEPRQSEMKSMLAETFATREAEDWFVILGNKDCCVTPVRTLSEAIDDGHFHGHELGLTPRLTDTPGSVSEDGVPELGEHSIALLERVGFSRSELHELKHHGVIQ